MHDCFLLGYHINVIKLFFDVLYVVRSEVCSRNRIMNKTIPLNLEHNLLVQI